jgi:flagellar motor component MotA
MPTEINTQTFDLLKTTLDALGSDLREVRESQKYVERTITAHESKLEQHGIMLANQQLRQDALDKRIEDGLSAAKVEVDSKIKDVKTSLEERIKPMDETFKKYSNFWGVVVTGMKGIILVAACVAAVLALLKYFV